MRIIPIFPVLQVLVTQSMSSRDKVSYGQCVTPRTLRSADGGPLLVKWGCYAN